MNTYGGSVLRSRLVPGMFFNSLGRQGDLLGEGSLESSGFPTLGAAQSETAGLHPLELLIQSVWGRV